LLITDTSTANTNLIINLQLARTAGANGANVVDLILVPIQEGVLYNSPTLAVTGTDIIYDNTGYFLRGRRDLFAGFFNESGGVHSYRGPMPFQGTEFELKPGQANRLYVIILCQNGVGTPGAFSNVNDQANLRVNIVPRSIGLRTE
jgi:hypothetical protein